MNALKKLYRGIVDHLTKAIGVIGAAVTLADFTGWLEGVKLAASQYLPDGWAMEVGKLTGTLLFVLVIARGWWTGRKSREVAAELAAAKAATVPLPPKGEP